MIILPRDVFCNEISIGIYTRLTKLSIFGIVRTIKDLAVPADQDHKTISEALFHRVKADIVEGQLLPGSKLRVEALCQRYSTGATPLREALSRLSSLGFVTAIGQRGFRVAEVSPKDLIDLTKVRIWVESVALRNAIALGGVQWEASIVAAQHLLSSRPLVPAGVDGSQEQEASHKRFHDALVSACDSNHLLAYRERLFELSERYRRLSVEYTSIPRNPLAEHLEIAKVVLDRDAEKAEKLITAHFLKTMQMVLGSNPMTSLIAGNLVGQAQRDIATGKHAQLV